MKTTKLSLSGYTYFLRITTNIEHNCIGRGAGMIHLEFLKGLNFDVAMVNTQSRILENIRHIILRNDRIHADYPIESGKS